MNNTQPMKRGFPGRALVLIQTAVLVLASSAALAADSSNYRLVDGLAIYYATVPAEVIRGYPTGSPEAAMHGGVPKGGHVHHIIVALFDAKNLERITDAEVTANVGEVGFAKTEKQLEPFTVAGALTYGNFFRFPATTTYLVDIEVRRPGSVEVIRTQFEYRHH